jgi:hypothetical protein
MPRPGYPPSGTSISSPSDDGLTRPDDRNVWSALFFVYWVVCAKPVKAKAATASRVTKHLFVNIREYIVILLVQINRMQVDGSFVFLPSIKCRHRDIA